MTIAFLFHGIDSVVKTNSKQSHGILNYNVNVAKPQIFQNCKTKYPGHKGKHVIWKCCINWIKWSKEN